MSGAASKNSTGSPRLRHYLLAAYLLLVLSGIVIWLVDDRGPEFPIFLIVFLGLQWLFLALRGDPRIFTPMQPRRRLVPCIVAGLMGATLVASLGLALGELLFPNNDDDLLIYGYFGVIALSWIAWTFVFYVYAGRRDSLRSLRAMVLSLIGGSVVELLAAVPSHIVVVRRPGCLVGIGTMMGILGGLLVMVWAFGPGIVLLFDYEIRRNRPGFCRGCAYDLTGNQSGICPECGTPVTSSHVPAVPVGRPA